MGMETRFIGREKELETLERAFRSRGSALIPVYGRRRVGKSELILQFLKGKRGIYFLGKKAPPGLQIREFLEVAAAALHEPLLGSYHSESWKKAIEIVLGSWKWPGKLILVLDEFQWAAEASPELPSILQEFWDRSWHHQGNVLLILCGSYVGFMERKVLGRKSPLFGRRTVQMLVRPFGYQDAAKFHPAYSLVDRAKTYFLTGGIPLYLRYFQQDRSVEMNIVKNFLSEYAPLFREPDFLLREELREVAVYHAVLLAVASGAAEAKAVSHQTGIGDRALQYYLHQLVELGYLVRKYPLTGLPPASRSVRYILEDPMLRFWFRFVFPNTSLIFHLGPQRAMAERIRPDLEAHFGACFERLCREALPVLYAREAVAASFEIGEYWDKQVQIDVVGVRKDGWIDLGECQWGPVHTTRELVRELEAKIARFPNPLKASIGRRLFSRGAVPRGDIGGLPIKCHTLEDLYHH